MENKGKDRSRTSVRGIAKRPRPEMKAKKWQRWSTHSITNEDWTQSMVSPCLAEKHYRKNIDEPSTAAITTRSIAVSVAVVTLFRGLR